MFTIISRFRSAPNKFLIFLGVLYLTLVLSVTIYGRLLLVVIPFIMVIMAAISIYFWPSTSVQSNTMAQEPSSNTFKSPKKLAEKDAEAIIQWAEDDSPIENTDFDFFDMEAISTRMVTQILKHNEGISIGLMGDYGTGKSSIVNLVKKKLEKEKSNFYIVSIVNCWGFTSSASALESILNQVLYDISQKGFFTFSIYNLPLQFVREVTGNSTWYARLINRIMELGQPQDGIREILTRLSQFLEENHIHLVLVIEDIDRNDSDKSSFSTADVLAAVHRLKNAKNISLILAGRPYSEHIQIDFQKFCDEIESVPFVNREIVKQLFEKVEKYHQETSSKDLTPAKLGIRDDSHKNLASLWSWTLTDDQQKLANVSLERLTPRIIKHIIRRVNMLWESLHGECSYVELWLLTMLQYSAANIFGFIQSNIDSLRKHQNIHQMLDAFLKSCPSVVDTNIAKYYLEVLFPEKYLAFYQQGICNSSHVDYFDRIIRGAKPQGLESDQEELRAILNWKNHHSGNLVEILKNREGISRYGRWMTCLTGDDILKLTKDVLFAKVDAFGKDIDFSKDSGCGILAEEWSPYERMSKVDKQALLDWFPPVFEKIFPVNICFAADVYYHFACTYKESSRGLPLIPFGEQYEEYLRIINTSFINAAQKVLSSPEAIVENCFSSGEALKDFQYYTAALSYLIRQYCLNSATTLEKATVSNSHKACDFRWLAERLWQGVHSEDSHIRDSILYLVADMVRCNSQYSDQFWGEQARAVMVYLREHTEEISLLSQGEKVCVHKQVQQWLKDHPE